MGYGKATATHHRCIALRSCSFAGHDGSNRNQWLCNRPQRPDDLVEGSIECILDTFPDFVQPTQRFLDPFEHLLQEVPTGIDGIEWVVVHIAVAVQPPWGWAAVMLTPPSSMRRLSR